MFAPAVFLVAFVLRSTPLCRVISSSVIVHQERDHGEKRARCGQRFSSCRSQSNDKHDQEEESHAHDHPRGLLDQFWKRNRPLRAADHVLNLVLDSDDSSRIERHPLIQLVEADFWTKHTSRKSFSPVIFSRFYQGELFPPVLEPTTDSPHPPRKTRTFRMDLAYRGPSFCGWQSQGKAKTSLPAVQDIVEKSLGGRNVRVAGRTDAGVHAFGQVACVRTGTNMTAQMIQSQLSSAATSSDPKSRAWKCWRVVPQPNHFHPTFDAKSRSYAYILDASTMMNLLADKQLLAYRENITTNKNETTHFIHNSHSSVLATSLARLHALAHLLNRLFEPLVSKPLDFVGMSHGKVKTENTLCVFSHLRAVVGKLHQCNHGSERLSSHVLVVELTVNRFLRRQIRILVATALRHVVVSPSYGALLNNLTCPTEDMGDPRDTLCEFTEPDDSLLSIVEAKNCSLCAHAAPPECLVFVGVEF